MIILTSLSLGEILKKAGLNTLLGMGVVFTVLILISLLIYCMRYIPVLMEFLDRTVGASWRSFKETRRQKKAAKRASDAGTAAADSAAGEASEEAFKSQAAGAAAAAIQESRTLAADVMTDGSAQPDLTLIAVITAAIAAATDTPADGIVIRSIRRSTNNNWKRA